MASGSLKNESRGNLYATVQSHPLTVSEKETVSLFDRCRMDPRLMEVMTEFVRDYWWHLNPVPLNKAAKASKFPYMIKASVVIILENCEISLAIRNDFSNWVNLTISGIKNPAPQLMYVGLVPVGSKMLKYELAECLPELKRMNLIARNLPFNKGMAKAVKSKNFLKASGISAVDLLKISYSNVIKGMKLNHRLRNQEIIQLCGINRVFLSKILNNKVQDISVEYLEQKAKCMQSVFGP